MKVGFIGLGNMGNAMANNILKSGHELTVYDIERGKGRNLEKVGATWAVSPRDVATQTDVVISSLPGPQEVETVVLGKNGVFSGLSNGAAYIDTTTNAPSTMRKLAKIGLSSGFRVLDAPISGGIFGARDATLSLFVGGTKETFNHYQPLLQNIGKKVFYMGPIGSGKVTKLVNNLMLFINLIGACEGMSIGAKAGINIQTLHDAITCSMGQSVMVERCMTLLLKNERMHSATELAVKDMNLVVELGRELGVPLEVGPLTEDIITHFCDRGYGEVDINEIINDFLQRSGVDIGIKKDNIC